MEEICKQVQFLVLSICKVFIHNANKALQKWYGFMAIISNKLYLRLFNFIDIHVKIVFVVIQTFIASQVHTACVPIIQSNHPLQEIINCDVHTHTWIAHFKLNWVFNVFWPQFRQVSQTAQKCYSTCHVSTFMYFWGR